MLQFSLYKIVQILTPVDKRKPRFIAWLKVFVSYLEYIAEDLNQLWVRSVKEAKMTPQIIYLEHILNERYGTGSQIYIAEGYVLGPWCWFTGPPAGEIDMYMVEPDNYCYSSTGIANVDFVVMVPMALQDETSMIGAIVQKFKLAGMYFIIQLY